MMARNKAVVPEAREALNQFKIEVANELGIANYDKIDKGELTSRQNGYVGGYMVKHLIEMAERQLADQS
ncbi:alpha/beta-type small acid-soluble spore protein [Clostridiaceae bacterium 35-E11]